VRGRGERGHGADEREEGPGVGTERERNNGYVRLSHACKLQIDERDELGGVVYLNTLLMGDMTGAGA
jgi:hypothetical protein